MSIQTIISKKKNGKDVQISLFEPVPVVWHGFLRIGQETSHIQTPLSQCFFIILLQINAKKVIFKGFMTLTRIY